MAYGYCFGCGTRVSTSDLKSGHARRFPQGFACRSCARECEEALLLAGPAPGSDNQGKGLPDADVLEAP